MAYGEVPVRGFGGLDLASSPDEATGAIDMLNCDLDRRGAVRQRDGFDNLTSAAASDRYVALAPFYTLGGQRQLITGAAGGNMRALNTSGGVVATSSIAAARDVYSFARFGGPTAEVMYVSNFDSATASNSQARKWDGSAWTALNLFSTTDYPRLLALQPVENRLIDHPNQTVGKSRVAFSNAGAPETFGANDYVDLTPGDGERINAMVAWRESVFVFKETRFFVFYGNSVSATGTTVFNYRPVDTGLGAASMYGAVAGSDGVYFVNRRGVFRTTGGAAVMVSKAIEPIFRGGLSAFFQSSAVNQAQVGLCALGWHGERLFLAYPSGAATANDRLLVYDPAADYWTLWDIPAAGLASFRIGDAPELVFSYAAGSNHVGRHSSSYSNDDGAAITSRYRSGFYDLGRTNEKTVRETELWGTGTVGVALSKDFGALDTAANVTLGTSPAVARGVHQVSKKGTLYSFQLSSVSGGAWTVHRLSHNLQGDRPVGMRS